MKPALVPYAPLNALKYVAEDIWIVDGPEIAFGMGCAKLPFPTRMTVVRLRSGELWLHSPTRPTEDLVRNLDRLGRVSYLVAPNTLHYWWIPEWQARYPRGETHGAPGLASSLKRELQLQHVLGDLPPSGWELDLGQVVVRSDVLTEVGFFHRPSRTLILTDLIENFELTRVRPWWLRLLLRLSGAVDPDGKAPIDMQYSFIRQREALRRAVERMIAWRPKRLIIAHGRWYREDAVAELRRAFRWVLRA